MANQAVWYLNRSFSLPNLALLGAYFAKSSKNLCQMAQILTKFGSSEILHVKTHIFRSAFDSNLPCISRSTDSIHVSREYRGWGQLAVGTSYIFQSANLWLGFLAPPPFQNPGYATVSKYTNCMSKYLWYLKRLIISFRHLKYPNPFNNKHSRRWQSNFVKNQNLQLLVLTKEEIWSFP